MKSILEIADRGCGVVLLLGGTTSFFILIAVIGLFRSCVGIGDIGIDDSYMTQRYQFARKYVTDSTGNGYELLWYTTNQVTEKRNDEIRTRQHIWDSYNKLEEEAGYHFYHNLINTDIYDFTAWAKSFDIDPDVRLVDVWVYGTEYKDLYHTSHANYPDGWNKYDDANFGILYLKEHDIYPYRLDPPRQYRYWSCGATSPTDERHTHITKSDRSKQP